MARSRSITANLSRFLAELAVPVYVVDERRMIVYVNQALEDWLAVSGEELVGTRCDFTTATAANRLAELAALLCPPPEAFSGQQADAIIELPIENGLSRRRARFVPFGEDSLTCEGVIALVDVSEAATDAPPVADTTVDTQQLHAHLLEFRRSQAGRYRLDRFVGRSPAIRRARQQAMLAASARPRMTVIGPTGSGREHVARSIHFAADAEQAPPLLPLAGPLLDAEMLQSSITAFARRCQQSEDPRPGTVLLVDADLLPADAQAELAGFLRLPGFEPLVIATAERSLLEMAASGKFHRELAVAVGTLVIELPSLSDRPNDIPLLAQMFVEQANAEGDQQRSGLSEEAIEQLCVYPWPGNVDELAAVVRAAHQQAEGAQIELADLPAVFRTSITDLAPAWRDTAPIVLDDVLRNVECQLIQRAIEQAQGNKTKAAELLGISRPRLHRRLEEMAEDERREEGGENREG